MLRRQEEVNRVTVRIWPSMFSSSSPGTWKSPGHVSLQTFTGGPHNNGYYISYWPAAPDSPCPCEGCPAHNDHFHELAEDTRYKGQADIENTYHLYTLNVNLVNQHFEERRGNIRWSVSGSIFSWRDNTTANCASLAHDCLVHGGLNNLVTRCDRTFLGVQEAMMSKVVWVSISVIPFALGAAYLLKNPTCRISVGLVAAVDTGMRMAGRFIGSLFQFFQYDEYSDPAVTYSKINALLTFIVTQGPALTGAALAGVLSLLTAIVDGCSAVTSNLMTFKPSDMQRIMPTAEANDVRRATLFVQQAQRELQPYKSETCAIM